MHLSINLSLKQFTDNEDNDEDDELFWDMLN